MKKIVRPLFTMPKHKYFEYERISIDLQKSDTHFGINKRKSIVLLCSMPNCILWTPMRQNMQQLLPKPKVLL